MSYSSVITRFVRAIGPISPIGPIYLIVFYCFDSADLFLKEMSQIPVDKSTALRYNA